VSAEEIDSVRFLKSFNQISFVGIRKPSYDNLKLILKVFVSKIGNGGIRFDLNYSAINEMNRNE